MLVLFWELHLRCLGRGLLLCSRVTPWHIRYQVVVGIQFRPFTFQVCAQPIELSVQPNKRKGNNLCKEIRQLISEQHP